jgi:flavin-dependent dehydrogenase
MLGPVTGAVSRASCQNIHAMHTFVESDPPHLKEDFPGIMLDRATFDQALVANARDCGAQCRLATTVNVIEADGTVRLSDTQRVRPVVLIGADGPHSRVGRAIGSRNRELIVARQLSVPLIAPHGATDIFLAAAYSGGYAWLFPRGAVANLGLGLERTARAKLDRLLTELHGSLVHAGRVGSSVLGRTGGTLPVGGLLEAHGRLGNCRVLLCGDAAGLTNPVTGAGISAAVLSGTLAGESAAAALAGDAQAAIRYMEELDDLFGPALARALRRRAQLRASYAHGRQPSAGDLRRGGIAYPGDWAA